MEDGPAGWRNIGMKVPGDGCEARDNMDRL